VGPARAGRGLPKAGGRALVPARLDLNTAQFGSASVVLRVIRQQIRAHTSAS